MATLPPLAPSAGAPQITQAQLDAAQVAASNQLTAQQEIDSVRSLQMQATTQALQTRSSEQETLGTALQTITQQAISQSQELIDNEIKQAKKTVQNSSDAV